MEQSIKTKDGVIVFLLVRRNMKHIRIRVTGEKQVVVSAPHRCAQRMIHTFVRDNEAFIRRQLDTMEACRANHYPERYEDGDSFSFLGQRAQLRVTPSAKASMAWHDGELELFCTAGREGKGAVCPLDYKAGQTGVYRPYGASE